MYRSIYTQYGQGEKNACTYACIWFLEVDKWWRIFGQWEIISLPNCLIWAERKWPIQNEHTYM